MSVFNERFPKPKYLEEDCPEFDMYCIEDWEFIKIGWLEAWKYLYNNNMIKEVYESEVSK